MIGIGQILVIAALTMSSSALIYVGSATASATDFAGTSNAASAEPSHPWRSGKAVRLRRGPDGLFHMRVTFDGIPATAILDTGATHSIIGKATLDRLTRRNGHKFAGTKRAGVMLTLSGRVGYRMVPVDEVYAEGLRLGTFHVATIDSHDVPTVLGQNAISRFRSVTIEGDELILR